MRTHVVFFYINPISFYKEMFNIVYGQFAQECIWTEKTVKKTLAPKNGKNA